MPQGFDYSKWDKIELSDDEDDLHPNIDKDSWFRLKHRTRVEKEEDDAKIIVKHNKRLKELEKELAKFGEVGKDHLKAKKFQAEVETIQEELAKMEKEKKWNADNMSKTTESKTLVSASVETPVPEPRLQGEAVAQGYCEFIEEHEELLEKYISLGTEDDLDVVCEFLKEHGGTLLQGEHAESYLLLDCLEKEMNGEHSAMLRSARQNQFLTQLREFSRASHRPVRDGVHPVFQRLIDHEQTKESFDDSVNMFVKRVEERAVTKKIEMDAEAAENDQNDPGPGGLDPMEVLHSLPEEMQAAFKAQDIQRLQCAVEALPEDEAKYHLKRCEDSGLWVPQQAAGEPPYRQ